MFHKIISLMVGKREKGEEGSAWLARVGAPRTAESPCDPCVNPSLTSTCAAPAALNGSTLLFSREKGEEGRGECVDTMQWASVMDRTAILPCEARPSAPATHYLLLPSLFSLLCIILT